MTRRRPGCKMLELVDSVLAGETSGARRFRLLAAG